MKKRLCFLTLALVALGAGAAIGGAEVTISDRHGVLTTRVDGQVVDTQPLRHATAATQQNFGGNPSLLAGTITPIPEFVGAMNEPLDPPAQFYYGPPGFRAFGDSADMYSPMFYKGLYGVGSTCTIYAHEGSGMGGSWNGATEILFDTPVVKFGAYFGHIFYAGFPWNPTASFYDESDMLIETVTMNVPVGCTWTWNGFEVQGNTIKRIVLHSGYSSGQYLFMDTLTADASATGGDCDLTPVIDAIEVLEAKADALEAKADSIDSKVDTNVSTRASQTSLNAVGATVDAIDADIDCVLTTRSSQEAVDALEVKLDTIQADMPCEIIVLLSQLPHGPAIPTTHPCYEPPLTVGGGINTRR